MKGVGHSGGNGWESLRQSIKTSSGRRVQSLSETERGQCAGVWRSRARCGGEVREAEGREM